MTEILEILKYTIPALVVFATAYLLLEAQFNHQWKAATLNQRVEAQKITLPLRLQSYERLVLLCDRLSLHNLLLRVRTPGMSVAELKAALLIAISQEFDHNVSQQLYVSETLWQIIALAKSDTMTLVAKAAEGMEAQAPDEQLVHRLLVALDQMGEVTPLHKAQMAIRTEAGRLF